MTFAFEEFDLTAPIAQDDGFTLLEVLVALTILALSTTALFGAFFGSLEQSRQDAFASEARVLAQALLAEERSSLSTADKQGRTPSGFDWSVHVGRHAETDNQPATLHTAMIAIHVAWQDGGITRAVTVNTVAFMPPMSAP